jgi:hypothetical protein
VAKVEGNLTHVLISPDRGDSVQVFVNAHPIPAGELESLSVTITAPDERGSGGGITGIVSRYQTGADGARTQRSGSLFPGTVEVIARGRRIVVTCQQENSFEGLWLGLGLRADGTTTELTGVQDLRVVVTPTLIDAKLTWAEDGMEEDLLPDAMQAATGLPA